MASPKAKVMRQLGIPNVINGQLLPHMQNKDKKRVIMTQ